MPLDDSDYDLKELVSQSDDRQQETEKEDSFAKFLAEVDLDIARRSTAPPTVGVNISDYLGDQEIAALEKLRSRPFQDKYAKREEFIEFVKALGGDRYVARERQVEDWNAYIQTTKDEVGNMTKEDLRLSFAETIRKFSSLIDSRL